MFRSNLATYPYINPINTYGHNLGRAARTFVAALFAIDPSEETAEQSSSAETLANSKADSFEELNDLAAHFDAIMPNQAAELRYLAGRADIPENESA